ncbi:hypothetical protein BP5796_06073 [Coleophoma crateriformis]|uniref:Heterokaryon incompatibility domain-containing protein n=1 Tax=Coleophoma crateriformis TaxID=565419 RepID=A0A3D8RWP3_9HELO|nr:hypothetical protein BP5796_06073 [Coleophoma crateriformis]
MDESCDPFPYQALGPSEIRVLKPRAATSGTFSFDLVVKDLSTKPRYAALSYTWGPPGNTHNIILNGQLFPVRQNLHDALAQLAKSRLIDNYIWIDAICINQGEDEVALKERSSQIVLMKQVYEQAKKIVVWLGKPENKLNNHSAAKKLREFSDFHRRVILKWNPYRPWIKPTAPVSHETIVADLRAQVKDSVESGRKDVLDKVGSYSYNAWLGISELLKSPWWGRTWIFQEATVPESLTTIFISGIWVKKFKSKVAFIFGDLETEWNELGIVSVIILELLYCGNTDKAFVAGLGRDSLPYNGLAEFRSQRILDTRHDFLELIYLFRHTDCFDPRDKVYAPLGLATDVVRKAIIPDYASKTTLQVYLEVPQFYLAQPTPTLDFLGHTIYIEQPTSDNPFPSWLPNWSDKAEHLKPIPKSIFRALPLPGKIYAPIDRRVGVPDTEMVPAFNASDTPAYTAFILENELHVSAIFVDIIKHNFPTDPFKVESLHEVLRQWDAEPNSLYATGETFVDALCSTLVMDLEFDFRERACARGGKLDSRSIADTDNLDSTLIDKTRHVAMGMAAGGRTVAITEGGYVGMVPSTARSGDSIWALLGGSVLYTLRKEHACQEGYTFIGEVYLHGLMDGEVMKRVAAGTGEIESLVII